MATFTIQSAGTTKWSVEASTYSLESDFFHFYDASGQQVFAVKAANVSTVRRSDAN